MRRLALLAGLLLLAALAARPSAARALSWEIVPVGYCFTAQELIDTLGPSLLRAGEANAAAGALLVPAMAAKATRREEPSALLLSNSPETLDKITLPTRRGCLASGRVEAGAVRILVSHTNLHALPEDVVLRMTNASDQVADVYLEPRFAQRQDAVPGRYRMDAGVGGYLAQGYMKEDFRIRSTPRHWHPPDGDRFRILRPGETSHAPLVSSFKGMGTAWATVTTTVPLQLSVVAVPSGAKPDESCVAVTRAGSQVRGIFEKPDVDVEAAIDISDGQPSRYAFGESERDNALGVLDGGNWMVGLDGTLPGKAPEPQVNRGDFGGITYFTAQVTARPDCGWHSALLLLVAGGRKAAVFPTLDAKPVVLSQWSALAVGKVRPGQIWKYAFTLPPNSWAPVYLVAVPLRS